VTDKQGLEAARWAAEHLVGAVVALVNEVKRGGDLAGHVAHLRRCIVEADRELRPQLESIRARRPETDPGPWAGVRSATAHDAALNAAMRLDCIVHNAGQRHFKTHGLSAYAVRAAAKQIRTAVLREYGQSDLDHESMTARLTAESARAAAHWPAGLAGEDGPAPPKTLFWQGKPYPLPPRLWQLVHALWSKDGVVLADVEKEVWGEEGEIVRESTLRSTLSKLNNRLLSIGVPWQYHLRAGHIIRE